MAAAGAVVTGTAVLAGAAVVVAGLAAFGAAVVVALAVAVVVAGFVVAAAVVAGLLEVAGLVGCNWVGLCGTIRAVLLSFWAVPAPVTDWATLFPISRPIRANNRPAVIKMARFNFM